MNTQRDLQIARWMKLGIMPYSNMLLSYDDRLGNVEWNPAENPEQFLMILDYLTKQKINIQMKWNWRKEIWQVDLYNSLDDALVENKDLPIAFLQAVEQLIDNQTKQP